MRPWTLKPLYRLSEGRTWQSGASTEWTPRPTRVFTYLPLCDGGVLTPGHEADRRARAERVAPGRCCCRASGYLFVRRCAGNHPLQQRTDRSTLSVPPGDPGGQDTERR